MNLVFVIVGFVAALAGTVMLVRAINAGVKDHPRNTAMLIAGMMLAAFGMLLAGFAIGYATSEPLYINTPEPAR